MVLGRAVISDRSRGITAARALSVVMAIQGIAPVVAPILGGVLVEPIGWRGILGVVAAFTGLLVVMVLLWVPESLPAERRHDGGLRILLDGTCELARDHVLVRLLFINALSFGLLMAYLSAAPFVLRNVLGMGTVAYTAVFGLCGATVTVTIAVAASLVRAFGSAQDAWHARAEALRAAHLSPERAAALYDFCRRNEALPEKIAAACEKAGISLFIPSDEAYPARLKEIYNPPQTLFCRGSLACLPPSLWSAHATRAPMARGRRRTSRSVLPSAVLSS